jgi:hypothetical protein
MAVTKMSFGGSLYRSVEYYEILKRAILVLMKDRLKRIVKFLEKVALMYA